MKTMIAYFFVFIALMVIGVLIGVARFKECKRHDFTTFYCFTQELQ